MNLYPYLVLARPANIVTSIADILAGIAIVGLFATVVWTDHLWHISYLVISTIGLYGGGIVFNDVFDLEIDKVERPERPLPSGLISKSGAITFGTILLILGIVFAFMVSAISGVVASAIAISALVYDYAGKHHSVLGPINMGLCRGLNLLLGMTIVKELFDTHLWMMGFLPIVFVSAVTLTSRGEVLGHNKGSIIFALVLDTVVAAAVLYLGYLDYLDVLMVLPFLLLWVGMNFSAKLRAIKHNEPANIMRAVKTGVISIIPLDASYAAGFSHWGIGVFILLLMPLAGLMAKRFAVT